MIKSISLFHPYLIKKRNLHNVHICELLRNSESHLSKLPPNAKHCVRWKRKLQKLILVSEKHPFTTKYLRSRAAIAFEKRRHGKSINWWVIHPYSNFRFAWDTLMTFIFLYLFIVIPYIVGFHTFSKNFSLKNSYILIPGYIMCLVDIVMNYLTGFLSTAGHEVLLDPVLIIKNYSQGYFSVDLISSIPWFWIFHDKYQSPEIRNSYSFVLVQLIPLLKLFRLPTLRNYVKQLNTGIQWAPEHSKDLKFLTVMVSEETVVLTIVTSPRVALPLRHIRPLQILNATLGLVTMVNTTVSSLTITKGGYLFINLLQTESMLFTYVSNLHIGVSCLFGSNFIEYRNSGILFKSLRSSLLILGTIYNLYIVVILLQLVKSFADPELKYQEIMHEVKEYIRDRKPPKNLPRRLLNYYEYRFQGSFFQENTITSTLSSHLKHEIVVNSSRSLLETSSLFQNLPRTLLGEIITALKQVIYLEDDVIFQCETEGDCMYFIVNGTVAIISFTGKEICHLEDGNHFGELSLIFPHHRRDVSVIALEVCELLRFERKDFKRLVSQKSELYKRLTSVAQARLKTILKINKEAQALEEKLKKWTMHYPLEP